MAIRIQNKNPLDISKRVAIGVSIPFNSDSVFTSTYTTVDQTKYNIINYLYKLIQYCIDQYGSYEVHVNLDTFSVSSCHRYKDILKMYCDVCLNNATDFNVKLIKVYLYNIPNVFESISQILNPFIDKIVISKMVKFNKIDTKQILDNNNNSLIEYITKLN